jgi:carbonic anhydrase
LKIDLNTLSPISKENLKYDFPAGIAVFFVAVPLCLGIAHASGAPLISGLITGVIGGIVVGMISNSALSVSGPAAGLTAIAFAGIAKLGSFEAFLLATFLAGVIQILLGILRTGAVADYIPTTVIKGMLSAIGLILIIKQFPQLFGYHTQAIAADELTIPAPGLNEIQPQEVSSYQNIFSMFIDLFSNLHKGVMIIGVISLIFLAVWDKFFHMRFKTIPGSLLVVFLGVLLNHLLQSFSGLMPLQPSHLVQISSIKSINEFIYATHFPDMKELINYEVYVIAITIAIVASIETLLSVEAIDKLDPLKRKTHANRELFAQGVGNMMSGMLGGLPMTAVIVRGSVNVSAGARSRQSAILHGLFIVIAMVFLAPLINRIPLSCLAAVLVYTGYKLFQPSQFIQMYRRGWNQLMPFVLTIAAIIFTDLLIGVMIGLIVSAIFIVKQDYEGATLKIIDTGKRKKLVFGESITFLHKQRLQYFFSELQTGNILEIDASNTYFIDASIQEILDEFKETASQRKVQLIIHGPAQSNFY